MWVVVAIVVVIVVTAWLNFVSNIFFQTTIAILQSVIQHEYETTNPRLALSLGIPTLPQLCITVSYIGHYGIGCPRLEEWKTFS